MSDLKIVDFHDIGEDNCTAIMGGDDSNPTWQEYSDSVKDEYKQHFELIKKAIEDNGWIGMTGERQQNENISFKFSDGIHYRFTWRAWGDLMQAIVGKREGYMKYYM